MANLGTSYHSRTDYYSYPESSRKDDLRNFPTTTVVPNVPQSTSLRDQEFYNQRCQIQQTPRVKRSKPAYNAYYNMDNSDSDLPTSSSASYIPSECKALANRVQSRSDNLKRRPSLREAARSFRSSRVVKKLCRQGKTDHDNETGDEAKATSSESDNYYESLPDQKLGFTQFVEPPRSASVVSELSSGLQSTLTFDTHGRSRVSSSASQSSSLMTSSSDSASTRTSTTSLTSISKRGRNDEDEDLEGDDEDDGDRLNKRPCSISALGPEQPQLFACPFSKHDSHRYSAANLDELNYRGCSQSYLTDLARVKQHLYRVHERPAHHCPTCFEVFKNQAQCIKHVSMKSCHARPCPFSEKMTPEQLLAIKKKNRGTDPYLGWYEIYKTLFPGLQLPMSPYAAFTANSDTLESFMDHVARELPTRLQRNLNLGDSMMDTIQLLLRDALRDIRRDFNPTQQQRLDPVHRSLSEQSAQMRDMEEAAHAHNFHQSVTLTPPEQDKLESMRPPIIEIPPPEIYLYPPSQATQIIPGSIPTHGVYNHQQLHETLRVNYAQQQYQYSVQDTDDLQELDGITPRAIWPIKDSSHSYFVGQHQMPNPSLAYLQVHSDGNWIPNMVTTSVDQSMNDPSIQDMMVNFFPTGYVNHQT